MPIQFSEIPLETPMRKKPGPSKETIRKKAKLKIIDFDENSYLVGIKRGISFVKKLSVPKSQDAKTISPQDIERDLKTAIMQGDFDQVLFDDYEKLASSKPARKRGRKPVPKGQGKKPGRPKKKTP